MPAGFVADCRQCEARGWCDVSILAIDHVQLAMPEGREDVARAFYAGVLGLQEVVKPEMLAGRGGVWFEQGSVRVHLGIEIEFAPARKAHPAFLVNDLARVLERAGLGCDSVALDADHLGRKRLYLDDPFGNRVELIQP